MSSKELGTKETNVYRCLKMLRASFCDIFIGGEAGLRT